MVGGGRGVPRVVGGGILSGYCTAVILLPEILVSEYWRNTVQIRARGSRGGREVAAMAAGTRDSCLGHHSDGHHSVGSLDSGSRVGASATGQVMA